MTRNQGIASVIAAALVAAIIAIGFAQLPACNAALAPSTADAAKHSIRRAAQPLNILPPAARIIGPKL